ncbi:two-component sensor histidine kinase [Acidihalobacter prosperus]|uniref:histidine kinase n=2 Tax=Acidihalobacter prosperus TaxID=160660 RepID=A0A1A6C118_9GAMM|nr:two-component sensor histidine kinase [Acidihalobacter prosperus]
MEALQRLGAYHFQTRLDAADFPTMAPLADAFNTMADSIEAFVSHDASQRVTWSERDRLACMSQLTAGIAHEIRNPLEAIVNSVALLVRNNLTPREKQELSGIVSNECARLQRIFRHFIQFSRFPIARMEPTDLVEATGNLFTLLGTNNPESVEFALEAEETPVMALCDGDLIHQALMNLTLNALEAMPAGGRLTVRIVPDERHVAVSVVDSGEGIPADRLEQIMEPFYTSRASGVGLGLAITQHILAQHGTRLVMSSEPGRGTQASFILPRARQHG